MHDMVCDCPFQYGIGVCDLAFTPAGRCDQCPKKYLGRTPQNKKTSLRKPGLSQYH